MEEVEVPYEVVSESNGVRLVYKIGRIEYNGYEITRNDMSRLVYYSSAPNTKSILNWLVKNKDLIEAVWWMSSNYRKCKRLAKAYDNPEYADVLRKTAEWRRKISESLERVWGEVADIERAIYRYDSTTFTTPFGKLYVVYNGRSEVYAILLPNDGAPVQGPMAMVDSLRRVALAVWHLSRGDRRGFKYLEPLGAEHGEAVKAVVRNFKYDGGLAILALVAT